MRDYMKEISECRMKIKRLEVEINQLGSRLDSIWSEYGELISTDMKYITDPVLIHMKDKMGKKYGKLYDMLCELNLKRSDMVEKMSDLRLECRQSQARDYYYPIGMIDIFKIIHNDGFITGTKL